MPKKHETRGRPTTSKLAHTGIAVHRDILQDFTVLAKRERVSRNELIGQAMKAFLRRKKKQGGNYNPPTPGQRRPKLLARPPKKP